MYLLSLPRQTPGMIAELVPAPNRKSKAPKPILKRRVSFTETLVMTQEISPHGKGRPVKRSRRNAETYTESARKRQRLSTPEQSGRSKIEVSKQSEDVISITSVTYHEYPDTPLRLPVAPNRISHALPAPGRRKYATPTSRRSAPLRQPNKVPRAELNPSSSTTARAPCPSI